MDTSQWKQDVPIQNAAAVVAALPKQSQYPVWTKSQIMEAVADFISAYGTPPIHKQFVRTLGLPSPRSLYRFWPSIAACTQDALAWRATREASHSALVSVRRTSVVVDMEHPPIPWSHVRLLDLEGRTLVFPQAFWHALLPLRVTTPQEVRAAIRRRLWTWTGSFRPVVARVEILQ